MSTLIACVGLGKGTWSQVIPVIEHEDWDKVLVITNKFGAEKFPTKKAVERVIVDTDQEIEDLEAEVRSKIRGQTGFGDVGVNIVSGTGKEHMAIISALLKLGAGIRLVAWDGKKVIDF